MEVFSNHRLDAVSSWLEAHSTVVDPWPIFQEDLSIHPLIKSTSYHNPHHHPLLSLCCQTLAFSFTLMWSKWEVIVRVLAFDHKAFPSLFGCTLSCHNYILHDPCTLQPAWWLLHKLVHAHIKRTPSQNNAAMERDIYLLLSQQGNSHW